MNIETQVCTLQQSNKLKELGVNRESLFSWFSVMPDPTGEKYGYEVGLSDAFDSGTLQELIAPAYTISELGEMMPDMIKSNGRWNGKDQSFGCWLRNDRLWFCYYAPSVSPFKDDEFIVSIQNYNSCHCMADLLIFLIENNLNH